MDRTGSGSCAVVGFLLAVMNLCVLLPKCTHKLTTWEVKAKGFTQWQKAQTALPKHRPYVAPCHHRLAHFANQNRANSFEWKKAWIIKITRHCPAGMDHCSDMQRKPSSFHIDVSGQAAFIYVITLMTSGLQIRNLAAKQKKKKPLLMNRPVIL